MKYQVITDAQGYVSIIRHTGTKKDFVELGLSEYDLGDNKLHAYKLGKDQLIFDEVRYQQILDELQQKADQQEVADLKEKLNETDYIIARWGEELVALDNPLTWVTDVIKINLKYSKQYKEALANRKKWRERIEELENRT